MPETVIPRVITDQDLILDDQSMSMSPKVTVPPNNPTAESYLDVGQIATATPEGYVPNQYEQTLIENNNRQFAPQAIGPQGAGLYPGLNHNINVGGYSGSIIGSGNIYVPGGNITAVDPVLARRKAIDDAARLRAAELTKPYEYQKPKAFKDPRFQAKLDKSVFGFQDQIIKEAKDLYGENWRAVLKDQSTELGRKMVTGLHNYETIISNVDAITDLVAKVDEGLKDKSIYLTPQQAKTYNEYKNMLGNFEDYDKITNSDFEQLHSELIAARDFNDYLNKSGVLKDLQAQVNQNYGINDKGEYYNVSTKKVTSYKDIINDLTKTLAGTTFSNEIRNGVYSEEQLRGALDARLKDQVERSGTMQQKNEASVARGLEEQVPDLQSGLVTYAKGQEGVVKVPKYNADGSVRGESNFKSRADFNMNIDGGKNEIFVKDEKGTLVKQNFNGLKISDVQILDDYGKPKNLAGTHYVKLREISVLDDGTVVQKATIARPVKSEVSAGKDKYSQQTYNIEEELIVLEKGGKGTSAYTDIKTQLKNKKALDNYEAGYGEMKKIAKDVRGSDNSSTSAEKNKPKTVKQNGFTYTLNEQTGQYE